MVRRALMLVVTCALLVGCGRDGKSDDTRTTAVGSGDCEMTAESARRVHQLLLGTPPPALSEAGLVFHERTKDGEAATSTDPSPDGQRDVFVLVNDGEAGVLGLRGTTGSRSVSMTAPPGCGAIGVLPHEQSYGAQFTLDGESEGSIEPAKP